MNDFIVGQVAGFIIGLLSSFIFWYYTLNLKPRLEFPPIIVYSPNDNKFRLKFNNKGRRQIVDVTVEFKLMERTPGDELEPTIGTKTTKRLYQLNRHTIAVLESKQNHKPWLLPVRWTLSTIPTDSDMNLNLDELFMPTNPDGERRLVVTVSATDAQSGTKLVIRKAYAREHVVYGRFGRRFEVIEEISPFSPQYVEKPLSEDSFRKQTTKLTGDFDTLASELSLTLKRLNEQTKK